MQQEVSKAHRGCCDVCRCCSRQLQLWDTVWEPLTLHQLCIYLDNTVNIHPALAEWMHLSLSKVLQSKMINLTVGLNGWFTKFNREEPSVPQTLNHILMEFLIMAIEFTKLHAWNCERIIGTSQEAGEELPCTHALYMHTYIFDSPAYASNLKWHCVLEISITHSKRCGWENPIPVKQLTPGRPLWSQTHRHPKHPPAKPQ